MKASEVTFQGLVNGNIQYRVPLFQRTYSWIKDNWERLWDDVLDIYALPVPRTHFLGAIVTLPMPDSPERAAKYVLVDGQQRFTTIFVLLSVIRDAAQAQGHVKLAEQIQEECLINKYAHDEVERVKLRPTQKDEAAFRRAVLHQGAATNGEIGAVQQFFRTMLAKGDLDGNPIDLSRLKICITGYLSLVSIRLDQNDSPHRIFESLNNTGMALSAADLIRNYVFMRIPDEAGQVYAYETIWVPMEQRLGGNGESELTNFFWRYLMMSGTLVRIDEVYEAMRTRVDNETAEKPVVQFLEEIDRYSQYYARLWRPTTFEMSPSLRERLDRLNQWEVEVAYPFLMVLLDKLQQGVVSEAEALRIISGIESFVVRRYICNIPTNQLRQIFAQMAKMDTSADLVKSSFTFLAGHKWPSDQDFHRDFQTATIYVRSRLARTRFILTALERSYQHREPVEITSSITIEHVMPQTLSVAWKQELGARAEQVHEEHLHTIGNLTYSGYNVDMGNDPFTRKREILRRSHFELNKSIVRVDKWTESEIKSRAQELADRAVRIWKRSI